MVAVLAHIAVLLAVYVWAPSVGPPPEEITTVNIAVARNPFDPPAEAPVPTPTQSQISNLTSPEPPTDEPIDQPPVVEPDLLDLVMPEPVAVDVASPLVGGDSGASAPEKASDAPRASFPEGASGAYANRTGPGRGQALTTYGGDSKSESAVQAGLKWLAAHQRQDGAWDRRHFDKQCPALDVCRETAVSWPGTDAHPAVTGLALLAFLGAGHTHESGAFQDEVALAAHYLLSRQNAAGCFAPPDRMELYNDAIATLALAEAYALTGDAAFAAAVRSGVRHLAVSQQACGGWDYTSDIITGRCDLSITGWVVMALEAASAAGVAVEDRTVIGIVDMMSAHTGPDGFAFYANQGTGTVTDRGAGTLTRRYGPAMTAVGALVRQLLGWRRDSAILQMQTRHMLAELPDVGRLRGGDRTGLHSQYYWYYATLAMFNQGEPGWSTWNRAIRDALLRTQDRSISPIGLERHSYGSWSAFGQGWGKWGRAGGRVYATALAVMMLEVYYRYEPAFLADHGLVRASTLRTGLAVASDPRVGRDITPTARADKLPGGTVASDPRVGRQGTDREAWVDVVRQQPDHVAEPVLLDLLQDGDARVRLRAAVGLARLGSPAGESVLRAMQAAAAGSERQVIDTALEHIAGLPFPHRYGQVIRADEASGVVVFDTGGGAVHLGQFLSIERDRKVIARLRVTHRRPEHHIAAGVIIETMPDAPQPNIGDAVVR